VSSVTCCGLYLAAGLGGYESDAGLKCMNVQTFSDFNADCSGFSALFVLTTWLAVLCELFYLLHTLWLSVRRAARVLRVYVCACVCVRACVRFCVCARAYSKNVYVCVCACVCVHARVCIYLCVCARAYSKNVSTAV
jgi:hypothetical protein